MNQYNIFLDVDTVLLDFLDPLSVNRPNQQVWIIKWDIYKELADPLWPLISLEVP